MRGVVRAGLERAESLEPGSGFAEVTGGLRGLGADFSAYVRGELGYRPLPNVALFGFGEASTAYSFTTPAWQAGLGARVTW